MKFSVSAGVLARLACGQTWVRLAVVPALLTIAAGLNGCREDYRGKTLRVGADEARPYVSLAGDVPSGLAVDLLTEAARRRSITLQWVPLHGVLPERALDRGLVDIWPVLGVTEARKRKYHLTSPWFLNNFVLFSRRDKPIEGVEDARGVKISYASFPMATAMAQRTLPRTARLLPMPTNRKVLEAVCAGDTDAGFLEARTVEQVLINLPPGCGGSAFDIRGVPGTEAYGAIGARHEAGAAADALHQEILRMVDDGTFLRALDKWSAASASEMRSLFQLQRLQARDRLYFYAWLATSMALLILVVLAVSFYRSRVRAERARYAAMRRNEVLGRLARGTDHGSLLRDLRRIVESALEGRRCDLMLADPNISVPSPETCAVLIAGSDNHDLGYIVVEEGKLVLSQAEKEILKGLGDLVGVVLEHKKILDKLHFNARHDGLTGYVNRWAFADELENAILRCSSASDSVSVIFMDLDRFKYVNDRFGHFIGDLYLKEAARRVSSCLRAGDIAGRVGGDEFTILLPATDCEAGEQIASRIVASFARPFLLEGLEIYGTVSLGISAYPKDANTANELQINADSALYAAKEQGRNRYQIYSTDLRSVLQDGSEMEQLVRQALEHDYFEVFYQPQHRASGEFAGLEALVRIRHPHRGIVMPDFFIGAAERAGLVSRVDRWVLNEACRQFAAWRDQGVDGIRIAVNISGASISPDLLGEVQTALARWELAPSALEIELTETAAMAGGAAAIEVLRSLREHGVSLALDDFGTGYSSLSCLQTLPINVLKIDKSFVRNLNSNPPSSPLIQAIVATAKVLGMMVTAEGVETEEQATWLRENGCETFQGFYFSEALESEAAKDYVRLGHCSVLSRAKYDSGAFAA